MLRSILSEGMSKLEVIILSLVDYHSTSTLSYLSLLQPRFATSAGHTGIHPPPPIQLSALTQVCSSPSCIASAKQAFKSNFAVDAVFLYYPCLFSGHIKYHGGIRGNPRAFHHWSNILFHQKASFSIRPAGLSHGGWADPEAANGYVLSFCSWQGSKVAVLLRILNILEVE